MVQENSLSKDTGKVTCEIKMKLPSFNEYVNACRRNKYESANLKRKLERDIGLFILPLKRFKKPVKIHFRWVEKDNRRDLDNICYAKKFILDAMVKNGKLIDDSRRYVVGFTDTFEKGKETKVIIKVEEQNNENM